MALTLSFIVLMYHFNFGTCYSRDVLQMSSCEFETSLSKYISYPETSCLI